MSPDLAARPLEALAGALNTVPAPAHAIVHRAVVAAWALGYDAGQAAQEHALTIARADVQAAYEAGWAAREEAWAQEYARAVKLLARGYPSQAELARRRGDADGLRRALAQEERIAGWRQEGAA